MVGDVRARDDAKGSFRYYYFLLRVCRPTKTGGTSPTGVYPKSSVHPRQVLHVQGGAVILLIVRGVGERRDGKGSSASASGCLARDVRSCRVVGHAILVNDALSLAGTRVLEVNL